MRARGRHCDIRSTRLSLTMMLPWNGHRLSPRSCKSVMSSSPTSLVIRLSCPARAGRIWFLFTRPRNDDGVEDFFRFCGGESLYAAIDRDLTLGPILRSVGIPSVVEAAMQMSYFQDSLGYETEIARQFCAWRTGGSSGGVPHDRARLLRYRPNASAGSSRFTPQSSLI